MGITSDPRNDTALAYPRFSQRLGGQLIGFKIMGAQAKNTSPNAQLKNGLRSRPSISHGPSKTSPKYRPKIRVNSPLQKTGNEIKGFVYPPIRKVGYFLIITRQLSLINRFTIRKENLSPNGRNIVTPSN